MKIRHYGILASRVKPKIQQMRMGISIVKKEKKDWKEIMVFLSGRSNMHCTFKPENEKKHPTAQE